MDELKARSDAAREAVNSIEADILKAESAVETARASLRIAQGIAASADLDYGNAVRAAEREAETQRLNVELAQRNIQRRAELLIAGEVTIEEIEGASNG